MFDFIEIGSSDFDHEMGKGIFIEPVKFYFDKIVLREGCKKYNCAISESTGSCNVYYLEEEDIIKHKLPWWLRGCSSINTYHPQSKKIVEEKGLDWHALVKSHHVEKYSLYDFLIRENITTKFFKIDTEGHDCIIIDKFLEECMDDSMFPEKIMFESNILIDNKTVKNTINKLKDKSYTVSHYDDFNTVLTRK